MVSKTDICNRALIKIGKSTIRDLDTDESPQGTLCKAVYDAMLLEVLRQAEWNFAITRQTLNRDGSGDPLFDWSYRYILPTIPQVVKIISVKDDVEFRIEGNFLVTNAAEIQLKYIGKIADPNLYDALFIEAFVLRIASEIAFALTSQTGLVDKLTQAYLFALANAKNYNSQDTNELPIQESSWTDSRIRGLSNFTFTLNGA